MNRALFALCLLALPALAAQPPRVAALDWMAGTWTHSDDQGKVVETWLGPGNGILVAANLTTFADGRKAFEFLRITDTPEGFSYLASPGGRSPATEFRLKEIGDRRVVFENTAHDFPQRVVYWREGEVLMARIEGTLRGQERSKQWRFSQTR